MSSQTIYNWHSHDLVEPGLRPGAPTTELAAARRRISELETELAATKRAYELLKRRFGFQRGVRPLSRAQLGLPA